MCVVFEPDSCSLETHGLGALESLISVNSQGKVLIPVVNYHRRDVYLDEGTLLGRAELLSDSAEHVTADVGGLPEGEAAHVAVVTGCVSNEPQNLLDAIQWPVSVTPRNNDKLRALVADYTDVFALSDDALGCTAVAQHKIDTGDHAPIKQYP